MENAIKLSCYHLWFIIVASLCLPLEAQNTRKGPATTPTHAGVKYSQAPITADANTQTLGPLFVGSDARQIYEAIAKKGIGVKGEFESSADYATRLQAVRSGLIVGTISGTSPIGFVFPSPQVSNIEDDDPSGLYTSYDADKAEMSVSLFMTKPFQLGEKPEHYYKTLDRPEYNHAASVIWGGSAPLVHHGSASNAFGAQVAVTYGKYEEYGLKFEIDKAWRVSTLQDDPFFASASGVFQIPPNEARIVKDRLRVLVVCELSNNPLDQGQDHHAATITEPTDTYVRYKLLSVTPKEFWVFDQGTGKVYLKTMQLSASYPDQTSR